MADLDETIVRDLWTLRLSKLVHRLDSPPRIDTQSQAVSSTEESGIDEAGKRQKKVAQGIASPKLIETIALCYMGILLLRLPISLAEVYR
jgi:RNA polymerase I-specific transcription initiation factor RRN7